MGYRRIVKGTVVVLEGGITLPEGTEVEVSPVVKPLSDRLTALLNV
ncbi:MAG: hypothetical protein ACREOH_17090 [Candidatus Entotheonellia bacterium]